MHLQCFPPTRYVRAHKRDDLYLIWSKLEYRLPACLFYASSCLLEQKKTANYSACGRVPGTVCVRINACMHACRFYCLRLGVVLQASALPRGGTTGSNKERMTIGYFSNIWF